MRRTKFKKQIIAAMTVLCMLLLSFGSFKVEAANSGTDWTLDDAGKLTIKSDAGMKAWTADGSALVEEVKKVEMESGVTAIEIAAFWGCVNLTEANIPDSVTSLGDWAFQQCSSLTTLTLPAGITKIKEATFEGAGLTSITLQGNVTEIGKHAFGACANLKQIVFMGSTPPNIDSTAFEDSYTNKINTAITIQVPAGSQGAYANALSSAGVSSDSVVDNQPQQGGNESTKPDMGGNLTPDAGNTNTPDTGNTNTPDTGNTNTPDTGNTNTPDTGNTNTPDTGNTNTPDTGNTNTPDTGNTNTPDTGNTNTPDTGNTNIPDTGNTNTPDTGNTNTPDTGNTNTPGTGNTNTPGTGSVKPEAGGNISTGGSIISGTGYGNASSNTETAAWTPVLYKTSSSAAGVVTTVNGVYILNKGFGVAIFTSVEEIKESYGLAAGERAFAKVTDMDIKKSHQAKRCLDDMAAAYGAAAVGYINMEIGKMSGGKYSSMSGNDAPVGVTIGIPNSLLTEGANYAVVRVREGGKVDVLNDLDTAAGTVTIETTAEAAAYAVIKY